MMHHSKNKWARPWGSSTVGASIGRQKARVKRNAVDFQQNRFSSFETKSLMAMGKIQQSTSSALAEMRLSSDATRHRPQPIVRTKPENTPASDSPTFRSQLERFVNFGGNQHAMPFTIY
jgi:hypothetical protein